MVRRKIDPYATLGVARDAAPDEIKKAFRAKAKNAHPDRGGSPEKFAEIKKSELILLDPERRAQYDATGEIDEIEPDQETARIFQLVAQILGELIADESHEPSSHDLVDVITNALRRDIEAKREQLGKIRRLTQRAARLGKRFRKKSGKGNALDGIVGGHVAAFRRHEADLLEAIGDRQKAIELVSEYVFEREIFGSGPFAQAWSFGNG